MQLVYLSSEKEGLSWSWWYGSWIFNYLCNQYISPLTLWIRIRLRRLVLDIVLCDKVCQWLTTGRWFSPGSPVSSTNKTWPPRYSWKLLKVVLNTITLTPPMHGLTLYDDNISIQLTWNSIHINAQFSLPRR